MNATPAPDTATRDPRQIAAHARAIRRDVLRMIAPHGQGYVQQGLGAAELFATLYFAELRTPSGRPDDPDRDRCILSTAHNSAVFHATLAARGLLPSAALPTYCQDGSPLEINVSERLGPLVEATCGSLGQGLSVGLGMALSCRRRESPARVYVILGDGELQEGQVWEAALAAASFGTGNLCVVLDLNRMQVEGDTDRVLRMAPIADKWRAFGWQALPCDGHDIPALLAALDTARATPGRPTILLAETVPGHGVSFLAGTLAHHMKITPEQVARALHELGDAP